MSKKWVGWFGQINSTDLSQRKKLINKEFVFISQIIHPQWVSSSASGNVSQVKLDGKLKWLLFLFQKLLIEGKHNVRRSLCKDTQHVWKWVHPCFTAFQLTVNDGTHAVVFEYLKIKIMLDLNWLLSVCCFGGLRKTGCNDGQDQTYLCFYYYYYQQFAIYFKSFYCIELLSCTFFNKLLKFKLYMSFHFEFTSGSSLWLL